MLNGSLGHGCPLILWYICRLKYCATQQLSAILHFVIHLAQHSGILAIWALGSLQTKNCVLPQFCQCRAGILWRGLQWSLCTGWHSHSPWSYLVWGWVQAGCGLRRHAAGRAPGPHCQIREVKWWKAGSSTAQKKKQQHFFHPKVLSDSCPDHIEAC